MAFKVLLAFYLIVAVAMIFFILMQRGAGAQAGSGFGAGASGTVFGASGAGNFLTSSTKWLAVAFFGISIGMGVYVSHTSTKGPAVDLGVMGAAQTPADTSSEVPATPVAVDPEVPQAQVPAPAVDATSAAAEGTDVVPATPAEGSGEVEKTDKP